MTTKTATMKAAWKPNNLPVGFVYTGREFNRYGFRLPEHPLHNPYSIAEYGNEAVPMYADYVMSSPDLVRLARSCKGWTLVCWKHERGQICHNAIIAAIADGHSIADITHGLHPIIRQEGTAA